MIKLVIFDLDGTLADTIPLAIKSFSKAASSYAGRTLTEKEIVETFGINEIGMMRAVLGKNCQAETLEKALTDYYKYYEEMHELECPALFSGVTDLLNYLKKKPLPVSLITGKCEKSCMISLHKFGIENIFDDVITGSEHGNIKSENIKSLLQKYNLQASECFYVGDAVSDVTESQKAGVTCLSAAWSSTADKPALQKANHGNVFERICDLQKFFANIC